MIHCFVSKFVQLPGMYITVQLLIPALGVEFGEPLAEPRQITGRELGNRRFDFVESVHTNSLGPPPFSVNGGADSLTGSMPDAAPNGGNQRRNTNHCTNATARCTTIEGVPEGPLRQCCVV